MAPGGIPRFLLSNRGRLAPVAFRAILYRRRALEPIQEVGIHEQRVGLVKRLSMMRIMARRTKAATVLA